MFSFFGSRARLNRQYAMPVSFPVQIIYGIVSYRILIKKILNVHKS